MGILRKIWETIRGLDPVYNDEQSKKHNYHIDMSEWEEDKRRGTISKRIKKEVRE